MGSRFSHLGFLPTSKESFFGRAIDLKRRETQLPICFPDDLPSWSCPDSANLCYSAKPSNILTPSASTWRVLPRQSFFFFSFASLQGFVLTPHILYSKTDNSILRKEGGTVLARKILQLKRKSGFLAIWSDVSCGTVVCGEGACA